MAFFVGILGHTWNNSDSAWAYPSITKGEKEREKGTNNVTAKPFSIEEREGETETERERGRDGLRRKKYAIANRPHTQVE